MPVSKRSISLSPEIAAQIAGRGDEFSPTLNRHADRYFAALDRARRGLRLELKENEIALILDCLNGIAFTDSISIAMVADEISDGMISNNLDLKWKVDRQKLEKTIKVWNYYQCLAIVDVVERWWRKVANGEKPDYADALK